MKADRQLVEVKVSNLYDLKVVERPKMYEVTMQVAARLSLKQMRLQVAARLPLKVWLQVAPRLLLEQVTVRLQVVARLLQVVALLEQVATL